MSLLATIIEQLEVAGWYWDEEHFAKVWDRPSTPEDRLNYHCWTVPQWAEYWSSDHLPPKGPKPKKRRYESLKDAIWSQILREEQPKTYGGFFDDPQPKVKASARA